MSHSRVSCFVKCPYQYSLKYREKLKTIRTDDPQSPLVLGRAIHTGIEKDTQAAIEEYYGSYPIISDKHVEEAIKLEYLIPKVKEILPEGYHEVKVSDDDFVGYIDLLVPVQLSAVLSTGEKIFELADEITSTYDDYFDIYDFKYSNNVANYVDSEQLHLYKYYFEKANHFERTYPGKKIRNMFFVFIPKVMIRRKKKNKTNKLDETDFEFRRRILTELEKKEIQVVKVPYDPNKVIEFLTSTKHLLEEQKFEKHPTRLCDWCEYQQFCEKGIDYMILPKNERRPIELGENKKIWIYGAPFSGKTTLVDKFPNLLILSTDGNIHNVTAPYIRIKDEVEVTGRMTKKTFAWEVFKDVLDELEKKQNDFESISIDLVEDTREMCRLYMYDKLGIQHESDSGYGKGWDVIKTEYLSTMRRFFNLDYKNLIIVSHEDVSKSITKKSGEQITRIAPNIPEGIATKLEGMVDIIARVVVDNEDDRRLSFKADSVVFGGGRLNVKGREIPLDYDELMKVYEEANAQATKNVGKKPEPEKKEEEKPEKKTVLEPADDLDVTEEPSAAEEPKEEKPVRRRRKRTED